MVIFVSEISFMSADARASACPETSKELSLRHFYVWPHLYDNLYNLYNLFHLYGNLYNIILYLRYCKSEELL